MFVHLSTALKGIAEREREQYSNFIERADIFLFGCVSLPAPTGFISHFHIDWQKFPRWLSLKIRTKWTDIVARICLEVSKCAALNCKWIRVARG